MKIAYILNYLISANLFYISKYLIQFFFPLIKQLFQSFTYKKIILYNDTNKHRDKSCFNPSTLLFTFPIILYDCKRKRTLLHTVRSLAIERLKGSAADLVQISRSHSSQSTLASRIASKNSLKKEYQNNFSSLTLISSLVSHYRNYFHDLVKRRLPRKRITIQRLH